MVLIKGKMTQEEKWGYLNTLDEMLLQGGVILSEWARLLVKDADLAFVGGAYLSSIITSLAGIETHLRSECMLASQRLVDLIDKADLDEDLRRELHDLRKYRNKWVHITEPWKDEALLSSPDKHEAELEEMAKRCAAALRRTIYNNQCV